MIDFVKPHVDSVIQEAYKARSHASELLSNKDCILPVDILFRRLVEMPLYLNLMQ